MKSSTKKCAAKTRKGNKCEKHPMDGRKRCMFHGGKSTGPKTPKGKATAAVAPIKHGAYTKLFKHLFSRDDKKAYNEIVAALESDEFKAADSLMRESIALLLVRASKVKDPARILSEVRNQLKDLKVSRIGREGERHDIRLKHYIEIKMWQPEISAEPEKKVISRRATEKRVESKVEEVKNG